jgi:hypothetical protein
MKMKKAVLALAFALPFGAIAQDQQQLIDRYTALAGSKENATSLVSGLREGKEVTLTRNGATETFTPPTGKMGYGNVDNALAIAQTSLRDKGIANPTPAQLEAAVTDVLKLRADGRGWGEIAQTHGFKLGDVKRAPKPERVARAERADKPEKPERPQRPERPERPEKPERSAKAR